MNQSSKLPARFAQCRIVAAMAAAAFLACQPGSALASRKHQESVTSIGGYVTPGTGATHVSVAGKARGARINPKSGFFSLKGKNLSGPLTLIFTAKRKKYSLSLTALAGSHVSLSGVVLSAGGTAQVEQEDVEVTGTLGAVTCNSNPPDSLVINAASGAVTMSFDPAVTMIEDDATGTGITDCATLASAAYAGVPVQAEATVNPDQSLTATDINLNPQSEGGAEVDFEGVVTAAACPTLSVMRSDGTSIAVNTSSSTVITIESQDSETSGTCADIAVNDDVEVKGTVQSGGGVNATDITVNLDGFEASGTIQSTDCTATPQSLLFLPDGQTNPVTVTIGATTEIEVNDNPSASCANLTDASAEVKGVLQSDGSIAATSIDQGSGSGGETSGGGDSGGGGD